MDTLKPLARSLPPLTRLSPERAKMLQESADKAEFATERARLLLGQFRRGEANDPATFIASIAAILARHSPEIVIELTDPRTGLAAKTDWLPTVKEVNEACESLAAIAVARRKSDAVRTDTLERRAEEFARRDRPTLEQLRETYGPNFGLNKIVREYGERHQRRAARVEAALHSSILAEYAARGLEPVYAGDMVVSLELAERLNPAGLERA